MDLHTLQRKGSRLFNLKAFVFGVHFLDFHLIPSHPIPLTLCVRAAQIRDDYQAVRNMAAPEIPARAERAAAASTSASTSAAASAAAAESGSIPGMEAGKAAKTKEFKESDFSKLIDSIDEDDATKKAAAAAKASLQSSAIVEFKGEAGSLQPVAKKTYNHSAQVIPRLASKWPKPEWHAPWKLYRVISGHQGWVRSVTVDPSNEWFATGSADRTIKIWDLASGQLKLTLTGHIEQVTGMAVSDR